MKRTLPLFLLVGLGLSMVPGCRTAWGDLRRKPPEPGELTGAWVGYMDGGLSFYRLTLGGNGTGSCVVLYFDESVAVYTVGDWRVTGEKLSLTVSPASKDAEPIQLVVTHFGTLKIELVIKGVTTKWERKAILYNEREFVNRISKTAQQGTESGHRK
jgi:hypothetical protein